MNPTIFSSRNPDLHHGLLATGVDTQNVKPLFWIPTPRPIEEDSDTSHRATRADHLQFLSEGEFMANLKGLASIVSELRAERTNLVSQLRHVDAALSVLGKLNGGSSYTKPRRTLSASARKRISLAQKARWAKSRKAQKKG